MWTTVVLFWLFWLPCIWFFYVWWLFLCVPPAINAEKVNACFPSFLSRQDMGMWSRLSQPLLGASDTKKQRWRRIHSAGRQKSPASSGSSGSECRGWQWPRQRELRRSGSAEAVVVVCPYQTGLCGMHLPIVLAAKFYFVPNYSQIHSQGFLAFLWVTQYPFSISLSYLHKPESVSFA